jgi:hypothetical protein
MTCEAHSPMVEAWLVFIAPQPKKTDLNKACLFSRNKKEMIKRSSPHTLNT